MAVTYGNLPLNIKRVWAATTSAILEGSAFCYNTDYGTAADAEEKRGLYVEEPSTSNNYAFAGVAARAYTANGSGQWIDIVEPPSYALVYTNQSCTIGNYITACENEVYFYKPGFQGRGTAQILQTVDRSTAGLCLVWLMDGPESGLVQEVTVVAAGGAVTGVMAGGVTYHSTAVTLAADATYTVADGTFPGQKKCIICDATMTGNDIDVTVTSHSTSSSEHYFFKANSDSATMSWEDSIWQEISKTVDTST